MLHPRWSQAWVVVPGRESSDQACGGPQERAAAPPALQPEPSSLGTPDFLWEWDTRLEPQEMRKVPREEGSEWEGAKQALLDGWRNTPSPPQGFGGSRGEPSVKTR